MLEESSSESEDSDKAAAAEPGTPLDSARSMRSQMMGVPIGQEKAWVEPTTPPEPGDVESRFFSMDGGELLDTMGLSGMSIMCSNDKDFRQLVCIALQSFTLQYTMLYATFNVIRRQIAANKEKELLIDDNDFEEPLPMTWMLYFLMFAAIHVHFLNCMGDVPFSLNILLRIRDIHDTPKELIIAAPIFFIDALVTPTLQLVIGAVFLCSSASAIDVLLNSCAVCFFSTIDNMILTLLRHMKILSGEREEITVHLPFNKGFSKFMEATVCVFPIIPIIFTSLMIKFGESLGITPAGSGNPPP